MVKNYAQASCNCVFAQCVLLHKQSYSSILHFRKARMNLRQGSNYGQVWGTVGSGLTQGSPLGRRTPEIPAKIGKNWEIPENSENCM